MSFILLSILLSNVRSGSAVVCSNVNRSEARSFLDFCLMKNTYVNSFLSIDYIFFFRSSADRAAMVSAYKQEVGVDMLRQDRYGVIAPPSEGVEIKFSPPEKTDSILKQFASKGLITEAVRDCERRGMWSNNAVLSSLHYTYRICIKSGKRLDCVVLDPTFISGGDFTQFPRWYVPG